MKFKSFAKVNLFLNLIEKRSDNFHNLESVFQSISLYDTIIIEKIPDNDLSDKEKFKLIISPLSADFVWNSKVINTDDNLILKICEYFNNNYDIPPLNITLEKQIPIGSGLGGGSSNAAAMINGINKLLNLSLSVKEMCEIGAKFGSDIPFFIEGGFSKVTGRGDIIERKKDVLYPECYLVIVYPNVVISTEKAYTELKTLNEKSCFKEFLSISTDVEKFDFNKISTLAYNAFEEKAILHYPEIKQVHAYLKNNSKYVLLSGSGSSVFALYDNFLDADGLYRKVKKRYPYSFLTQMIPNAIEYCN